MFRPIDAKCRSTDAHSGSADIFPCVQDELVKFSRTVFINFEQGLCFCSEINWLLLFFFFSELILSRKHSNEKVNAPRATIVAAGEDIEQ